MVRSGLISLALSGLLALGCTGKISSGDAGTDNGGQDGGFDSGPATDGDGPSPGDPDAGPDGAGGADASGDPGQDTGPTGTLSQQHPNDVGMAEDPAVVWFEDFEEGSLSAIAARYDQVRDNGPLGYWIRDKFCTAAADGAECTDYPAPFDEILDLQFRSTSDLKLNAFWPQNYITEGPAGTLAFDQMVVATRRVGCMRH